VLGTTYQTDMVVVIGCDLYPVFAIIKHIVIQDNLVKFVLRQKETLSYRAHSCAYVVSDIMNYVFVSQDNFFSHVPLWQRTAVDDGAQLVSLRSAL